MGSTTELSSVILSCLILEMKKKKRKRKQEKSKEIALEKKKKIPFLFIWYLILREKLFHAISLAIVLFIDNIFFGSI